MYLCVTVDVVLKQEMAQCSYCDGYLYVECEVEEIASILLVYVL